jgi:hypothetical protein
MDDDQPAISYDDKIKWEFSHRELSIFLTALFVVFFLGYFTRSWTERPSESDQSFEFRPPIIGSPYSFHCEGESNLGGSGHGQD